MKIENDLNLTDDEKLSQLKMLRAVLELVALALILFTSNGVRAEQ